MNRIIEWFQGFEFSQQVALVVLGVGYMAILLLAMKVFKMPSEIDPFTRGRNANKKPNRSNGQAK